MNNFSNSQQLPEQLHDLKSNRQGKAIAFIDLAVDDYEILIAGVEPGTEAVLLEATTDGIEQITQVLRERTDIKTVHLVSHGSSGNLHLGSTQLNVDNLQTYRQSLESWFNRQSATDNQQPQLLLYGCQVAAGMVGEAFVKQLSQLTGAKLAASASLTGNAAKGGNWELEVRTGEIEAPLVFAPQVREAYAGVLVALTVSSTADAGVGSLREAITTANNLPGLDTISFNLNSPSLISLTSGQLDITDDLNIFGLGASNLTISGSNNSRVFNIGVDTSVEIADLTITDGRSDTFGGGLFNAGSVTLIGSTVNSNSAFEGGGIDNNGTVTLIGSTVSRNSTEAIGGIDNNGILTLIDSTVSSNFSAFFAGGIANSGSMTVTNSTISGNSARFIGGISNDGILTVTNSTISSNDSAGGGGGINNSGTLTVTNSTVSNNSSLEGGAGINNRGTLTVTNSTISRNSLFFGGGAVANTNSGSASIGNTIIAGNTIEVPDEPFSGSPDVFGEFNSNGFNLIGDATGSTGFGINGDLVGSAANPIDPLLGLLQNNGGSTATLALLPGSPAIDAANPNSFPATDQRGVIRPQLTGPDIGAFEITEAELNPPQAVPEPFSLFALGLVAVLGLCCKRKFQAKL
ncbi:MAG: DUF4347 domain-containing protein [Coleofasciculus sp. S288]|nr:DUF4347 domain-containing protein [Coleofasciculus sp. S288]